MEKKFLGMKYTWVLRLERIVISPSPLLAKEMTVQYRPMGWLWVPISTAYLFLTSLEIN